MNDKRPNEKTNRSLCYKENIQNYQFGIFLLDIIATPRNEC